MCRDARALSRAFAFLPPAERVLAEASPGARQITLRMAKLELIRLTPGRRDRISLWTRS